MKQSLLALASGLLFGAVVRGAGLTEQSITKHVNTLGLSSSFNPIKEAYWTGYPHHRRTPFAVSPDGTKAWLAYLDSSETDVHIQPVDPSTFASAGDAVTVSGAKEAGGLVAHDDGFALLTNEPLPSGTANAPAGETPVAVLYRYDASGTQQWKTYLGGPDVQGSQGLSASPDLNGDLVYSASSGLYAAYFVITAYSGSAAGHFGDAIRYVDATTGDLKTIQGASSDWGCSHNTGIAFEAADAAPFASICAEDQGAIWLNTKGQGMSTAGVKISNENTTNGGGGESLGGMSGSYSSLARFADSARYIFAWVSRGSVNLKENTWMGSGYTNTSPRTSNRNVAIAVMSDKNTLVGPEASSEVGAASGDDQVNWLTTGSADRSNAHVATFDASNALVAWEEIGEPDCSGFVAMGCKGTFTGAYYQLVSGEGEGAPIGEPIVLQDTYVAGDMVTMSDGRICWPFVTMTWSLNGAIRGGSSTKEMSFACASLDGSSSSGSSNGTATASRAATAAPSTTLAASTRAAAVSSTEASVIPLPSAVDDSSSSSSSSSSSEIPAVPMPSAVNGTDVPAVPMPSAIGEVSSGSQTATQRPTGSAKTCPPKRTHTVYV